MEVQVSESTMNISGQKMRRYLIEIIDSVEDPPALHEVAACVCPFLSGLLLHQLFGIRKSYDDLG